MKYRRLKKGDKIVLGTQFKWDAYKAYCDIIDPMWIRKNPIYNNMHPMWMRAPVKSKIEEMIRLF